MKYNKLVRDKIPEYIEKKGESAIYHIANDVEYWDKLKEKLCEEVDEFLKDESIDEIADVLEVIDAIIAYKEFHKGDIGRVMQKKFEEKGGFTSGVILEEA